MKVKKRNGEIVNFEIEKVANSIANASDETHEPLNMGDIDILTKDINHKLKEIGKEIIDSEEIFDTILLYLMKERFYHVAEQYRKKSDW
ncbi:ATP cone domain-containing protein [Oceanirhabdus sp. W0125-5]|uniref:ATP cone domain-containing protein n=1 Tax=Oceanirhabdus sp. W0125-5 TaxID=2999116 RepID=UPI0022F2F4F7|nr:ATP cone domain-containing protein [Oceanirhabdus sp. W0125-5]WBW95712.1 ATP cone domain-containing protein [Oceanirhabdus sp. W0125-5]